MPKCQHYPGISRTIGSGVISGGLFASLTFWGLLAIGLLGFALLAFKFWPYTMDDSYMTFRYAKNFAAGHGLVFNIEEHPRAGGLTSPLYAILLSLTPKGFDIPIVSKLVGLLSVGLTAFLVGSIIFKLSQSLTTLQRPTLLIISAAGSCYYLLNPYIVGNAVSGMETSLSCLAFAAFLFCWLQVLLSGDQPRYSWIFITAITGTIIPMLRPEMVLVVFFSITVWGLLTPDRRRTAFIILFIVIVLGTLYFVAQYIYYQMMFPLPFYIKQGGFGIPGWSELSEYIHHSSLLIVSTIACLAFSFARDARVNRQVNMFLVACIFAIACQLAYYSTRHHIMGFCLRYFQPVSVGMVIVGFVGVIRVYDLLNVSKYRDLISLPTIFSGLFVLLMLGNARAYISAKHILIDSYSNSNLKFNQPKTWQTIIEAAKDKSCHIAMNDCGKFPYYTDFTTIDLSGLNNRAIARGRSSEATLLDIKEKKPSLVILFGSVKNNILGLERLSSSDMLSLGYNYVGAIKISMMNGIGHCWLVFTKPDQATSQFLNCLARSGVFEYVQVASETGNHSTLRKL